MSPQHVQIVAVVQKVRRHALGDSSVHRTLTMTPHSMYAASQALKGSALVQKTCQRAPVRSRRVLRRGEILPGNEARLVSIVGLNSVGQNSSLSQKDAMHAKALEVSSVFPEMNSAAF